MANPNHLAAIQRGVKYWNSVCSELSSIDLTRADLRGRDLTEIDLVNADLSEADLRGCFLISADLDEAILQGADLSGANLTAARAYSAHFIRAKLQRTILNEAYLWGARLEWTHLEGANLRAANLTAAYLEYANLRRAKLDSAILESAQAHHCRAVEADFMKANLENADFSKSVLNGARFNDASLRNAQFISAKLNDANFSGADLTRADLNGAKCLRVNGRGAKLKQAELSRVDLSDANLRDSNLSGATLHKSTCIRTCLQDSDISFGDLRSSNLRSANLAGVRFISTDLSGADISNSWVYGTSAWGVDLSETTQTGLLITSEEEAAIEVDNLEVAQFIYLLLDNSKIRTVIETIGRKGVLILGRFTSERKAVLETIREGLRELNFVPIVFDFKRPLHRDFTETIQVLAGLSRFIIADITNPRSSPLELQATMPDYMIPFVPIIHADEEPFAMFQDLQNKHADRVLDLLKYDSPEKLKSVLHDAVVTPALEKSQELLVKKNEGIRTRHVKDYS